MFEEGKNWLAEIGMGPAYKTQAHGKNEIFTQNKAEPTKRYLSLELSPRKKASKRFAETGIDIGSVEATHIGFRPDKAWINNIEGIEDLTEALQSHNIHAERDNYL